MTSKYDPQKLNQGWNVVDGEEIFFHRKSGLGLWAIAAGYKKAQVEQLF